MSRARRHVGARPLEPRGLLLQRWYIGQHGSWSRKPRSGYAIIFIPFEDETSVGWA